ncbi:hypothetical protein [Allopusillimonas ginsengisoli]|uniref:hypothetical protein n=1 Tax=Allopusillimonas ginsengisoli TaxID=453575 RepID=UPI0010220E69|nr:hypothetical protein [Allopusillimonas ginsengisoli]TEA79018.1 hypothetical protein ERE07_06390 [Allopusillimonas ginsengisoli]
MADYAIVTPSAYYWTHPYMGDRSYSKTRGAFAPQSVKNKKVPDQDALLAIAEVFSRRYLHPLEDIDVLVTSITALLLSAQMRIMETVQFRVDCLARDKDKDGKTQYYLKYWVPKINSFARKPIPETMAETAIEAIRRLNPHFPYQGPVGFAAVPPLKMSESLLCCLRYQFSTEWTTSPILLTPFDPSYYSARLSASTKENGKPCHYCFYTRHGFEPVKLKSHSPRHLLNRLAKQSGISIDVITAWSSRTSSRQTLTYLDNDLGEAADGGHGANSQTSGKERSVEGRDCQNGGNCLTVYLQCLGTRPQARATDETSRRKEVAILNTESHITVRRVPRSAKTKIQNCARRNGHARKGCLD